jgi:type 1 glutamine amidotransferase
MMKNNFDGASEPIASSAPAGLSAPKAAWNGQTNIWAQMTAGGQPFPPEYYEMFGDPIFIGMDLWPLDHPTTFNRMFASGGFGTHGLGQSYLFENEAGVGLPSGPAIPKDEPADYPWDPSGGRGDPGFDILILNDQTEWTSDPSKQPASTSLHAPDKSQRGNIQNAVAAGKGFVVMHHALGDNNKWPWWYQEVTGGLLILNDTNGMKKTTISKSISMDVKPVGDHPILIGIKPFHLNNENGYKGMWQSPNIIPLLQTSSSGSDKTIAWIGPSTTWRVVCIQPGAAGQTYRNENFRRFVRNSILWCARRLD